MLEDDLKDHRKKLEVAINMALTDSSHINTVIQEIRLAGCEVFLIIEATIGFNKNDEKSSLSKIHSAIHLKLTTQDEKFLRSLRISPK